VEGVCSTQMRNALVNLTARNTNLCQSHQAIYVVGIQPMRVFSILNGCVFFVK
jgi:hypothetical protein